MKLCITSTRNTFSGGVRGGTPPGKWKKYQWALRNTGCYGPRLVLLLRKFPCPLLSSLSLSPSRSPSDRRVEQKTKALAAELVVFLGYELNTKKYRKELWVVFLGAPKVFFPPRVFLLPAETCFVVVVWAVGLPTVVETQTCMKYYYEINS